MTRQGAFVLTASSASTYAMIVWEQVEKARLYAEFPVSYNLRVDLQWYFAVEASQERTNKRVLPAVSRQSN